MYHRSNPQQLEVAEVADFCLPFSGHLSGDNRWVQLASLVPWQSAEVIYHADCCEDIGASIVWGPDYQRTPATDRLRDRGNDPRRRVRSQAGF